MGQFILLAGAALQASAQIQESGAKEVELELAKRDESSSARDREVQRKRRIAAIIGSQAAGAAAKGLQLSGSVANISIVDAKRAGEERFIDEVNTRSRINALSRHQRSIRRVSTVRGAGSILSGFDRFSSIGKVPKRGATSTKPERLGIGN